MSLPHLLTRYRRRANYFSKYGDYIADNVTPTLVLDMCAGFYGTRPLDETDYKAGGVAAKLVLDFNNDFFGSDT